MATNEIVDAMLNYLPCPNFNKRLSKPDFSGWGLSRDSIDLLMRDANALLFASIFDRLIEAEQAWEVPYKLKIRLGHLDVKKLSSISSKKLADYIGKKKFQPSLHRFPNVMADCMVSCCNLLINKYQGNAENIWKYNNRAKIVYNNLIEFKGISQKIANMLLNILIKYYAVNLTHWNEIDVAVDRHVARFFLRTRLIDGERGKRKYKIYELRENIINQARRLYPKYPGALDEPAFVIGREWCTTEKAYCHYKDDPCPLAEVCSKDRRSYQVS